MSPVEARERADRIIADLAAGGDPERAHGDQDQFLVDVLRAIAGSARPLGATARLMADQALRVAAAPGDRWYA